MRRVVVPALGAPGETVTVAAAESHHLLHVLRLAPGDQVRVTDGNGQLGVATFRAVVDGQARLELVAVFAAPPPPRRIVVLGLPRPALLEEALQLGTEAGATAFLLVRARFSPPGVPRPDRLDRVVRTAVTQCGRADLPAVIGPRSLAATLDDPQLPPAGARWLAAPQSAPMGPSDGGAAIAVGPEGGWAPEEVEALLTAGFVPGSLGPFVLRTPSAVAVGIGRLWPG